MDILLREYFPILVFLVIAGAVAVAMVAGSLVLARQRPDSEKLSPYECGFEPFDDARIRFDEARVAGRERLRGTKRPQKSVHRSD